MRCEGTHDDDEDESRVIASLATLVGVIAPVQTIDALAHRAAPSNLPTEGKGHDDSRDAEQLGLENCRLTAWFFLMRQC